MRRRLTGAILLLYPRRVRKGHGPEIVALIDDLIAHEGRSRAGLFLRLAADGLVQRIASTATARTMLAVLAATSLGGLAVSDFAAASAHLDAPRPARVVAPASRTRRTPPHPPRRRRTSATRLDRALAQPPAAQRHRTPRSGYSGRSVKSLDNRREQTLF
jgi:hypothetical protein